MLEENGYNDCFYSSDMVVTYEAVKSLDKRIQYLLYRNPLATIKAESKELRELDLDLLERLKLGWTNIGYLRVLERSKLKKLNYSNEFGLSRHHLGSDAAQIIGNIDTLTELNLDYRILDVESVKPLSGLTNLEILSLCECRIASNAVEVLCELVNLRELCAGYSDLPTLVQKKLRRALPNTRIYL